MIYRAGLYTSRHAIRYLPDRQAAESATAYANAATQYLLSVSAGSSTELGSAPAAIRSFSVPDRQAAESATAHIDAALQYLLSVSAGSSTELGSAPAAIRSIIYLIARQPSLQRLTRTLPRTLSVLSVGADR